MSNKRSNILYCISDSVLRPQWFRLLAGGWNSVPAMSAKKLQGTVSRDSPRQHALYRRSDAQHNVVEMVQSVECCAVEAVGRSHDESMYLQPCVVPEHVSSSQCKYVHGEFHDSWKNTCWLASASCLPEQLEIVFIC